MEKFEKTEYAENAEYGEKTEKAGKAENFEKAVFEKAAKTKIYIADATEENNLKDYFEKNDKFEVVGSSFDGAKVVQDVQALCPDVLVMEVMLSSLDGFAVMEKLKQVCAKMPKVFFVTNLSHSGFVTKALQLGASYFMVKPVSAENLEKRIFEALSQDAAGVAGAKNADSAKNGAGAAGFSGAVSVSGALGGVAGVSGGAAGAIYAGGVSSGVSSMDGRNETSRQLDEKISNIFISIGIPAHIKGYQFLREAVKLAVEEPEIIGSITKKLYPTIAERFETSSSKVERGMRHAIEVAWNRGKIENINNIFGLKIYNRNEKPTNGELIALIADKMIMDG